MTTQDIINAAMELSKKDKNAVINALLASMSENKMDRKMPTAAASRSFHNIYAELKHCNFGPLSPLQFKALRRLLLQIESKMVENGIDTISDVTLVQNFEVFLKSVAYMHNRWYFDNRFTPEGLDRDFEKIYSNLKKTSTNANRPYDYL